jgi:hypothetical protein
MFGVKYEHEKLALILRVVSTIAVAQTNEPVSSSARPLVYANFDPQIQSVNLTPNSDNSACPMIDVDQYQDGFRTSKILPYSAHLGGEIGWWFPVSGQWLSVGFGLSKEGYIEFFYNSETEEDLKDDRKRKFPNKVSEIESWKTGDAIYFDSMGGALITVGTGIPPFMTGFTAHVKAGWSHYIEKTDDENTIFITIRRRKIGEYRFGNSVSELGAAIGLAKENSKSFAYEMKLEKEDVKEAYELMMKGDFRKAQELAEQEREDI